MKKIGLSQNLFALVDDEDFEFLNQWKWCARKDKNTSYVTRKTGSFRNQKSVHMHRLILNPPDNMFVDHINGNGLDNRKINLRLATPRENRINSVVGKNNTTGCKGVSYLKRDRKYRVTLMNFGKIVYWKDFKDFGEAVLARKEAEQKYFGNYVRKAEGEK